MDKPPPTLDPEQPRSFRPVLPDGLRAKLHALILGGEAQATVGLAESLRAAAPQSGGQDALAFRAACLVLADLAEQGWVLRVSAEETGGAAISLEPPPLAPRSGETVADVKQRLRAALRVHRDRQLVDRATREFFRRVERPRLHDGRMVSIASIVDDGSSLADALRSVLAMPADAREAALERIVRPEIVACERGATCPITGLPLIEIWRYFRHTWSLEYRSQPGRALPLLIRNAARLNQPVIGIAMLASPGMRLLTRDCWIGWQPEELRRRVYDGEWDAGAVGHALLEVVRAAIAEIRIDDFGFIAPADLEAPQERLVLRLEQVAAGEGARRRRELEAAETERAISAGRPPLASASNGTTDWRQASEDALFKGKRADTLARLLEALITFRNVGLDADPAGGIRALFLTGSGRAAVGTALTEVRKRALASQVADVSVCGAVAPYNDLLGGKLVALLLASQDVRELYRARYEGQVSVIASQLAGRPVVRSSDLLLLTTTSLYGIASSQYNRLQLHAPAHAGLATDIHWIEVGRTEGYGTAHLGQQSMAALRDLSRATTGARLINNRFGEGVSPRLRQIREGLEVLGVDSDQVLNHAMPRIVYGCELVPQARERLVGLVRDKHRDIAATADAIAGAWRRRWLLGRITRPGVLERVRQSGPGAVKDQLSAHIIGQLPLSLELGDSAAGGRTDGNAAVPA